MTKSLQQPECKCEICSEDEHFPESYVIHLSGLACRCAEAQSEAACGCCEETGACPDCASLNQSVVVRLSSKSASSRRYEHVFEPADFASGTIPCDAEKVSLTLMKHGQEGKDWYSACVTFSSSSDSGITRTSWYRAKLADCCNLGPLRRHIQNKQCCWPKAIWVNGAPTPDYVPSQPEWLKGNPDDLNDAEYWPALDLPLMHDSTEVPVRYFNGELQVRMKDLGSDGFGVPWGHTRIYSNRLSNSYDFGNGYNWLVLEWPQLVRRKSDPTEIKQLHPSVEAEPTGCTLVLLRGTRSAVWFDEFRSKASCETTWQARFGAKHSLEFDAPGQLFRLTGANGHRWEFHAFTPNCFESRQPELSNNRISRLDGKFIRHVTPGGQEITATYENGSIANVKRSGAGTEERFEYEYHGEGGNCGRLRYVTWVRGEKLRRAEYTYYGKGERYGNLGDLKTARTLVRADGTWQQRENAVQYFRYEKKPNDTYCQGMLQCIIGPEAFHRIIDEKGIHPFSASDAQIQEYADLYVQYYDAANPFTARRVKTIALFGGARQHAFTYVQETTGRSSIPPGKPDYNLGHTTTKETRADGTSKEILSNFVGQTSQLDLSADGRRWTHRWKFHETHAGLVSKSEPSGKFHQLDYRLAEGNRAFLRRVEVGDSSSDPVIPLNEFTYVEVSKKYGILAVESERTIGVGRNRGGMQDAVTRFRYRWSGLGHMEYRATILPKVEPAHFPNAARYNNGTTRHWISEEFDVYGNAVRITDLRQNTTVHEMDAAKGVPKREIVKYRGRDGSQQNLIFNYTSDAAGRVTQVLGPVHGAIVPGSRSEQFVRAATWYLYKDLSGEVWTAQGYVSGGAQRLINPVQIQRYDRANRVTDSIVAVRASKNRPTIQETLPQSTWVRWVHQKYNVQRTKVSNRVYNKIPAALGGGRQVEGKQGEHYNETITESNIAVRRKTVTVAGGTVYETWFEARGLPVKLRAGTSHQEMSDLMEMEYDNDRTDNDRTGNGNVTAIRRHDGTNTRVTSFGYDFRDRQEFVSEADGGHVAYEYNNQQTVSKMTRSAGGAGLAERFHMIDVRGRVYQTQLNGWIADQNRTPAGPLVERTLYDDANQVIAVEPYGRVSTPSPVQPIETFEYDALGRQTKHRVATVASGNLSVLNETAIQRNEVGDAILVVTRGRFPDSELVGRRGSGDLGDENGRTSSGLPGATPARVSYVANWFDPLGRRQATADYGTRNPGGASARPTRLPNPRTESLIHFDFDESGELSSTTNALQNTTRFGYDHAGRVRRIANNLSAAQFQLLDQSPLASSSLLRLSNDATLTEFNYTAENKLTRSEFHNAVTGTQTSTTHFGADGTTLGRPAPTAHLPREVIDAERRSSRYTYNRAGEVATLTDHNGTTHQYEYDPAGRVTADRVINYDPAKIDAKVLRIEYSYDSFGRLQQVSSFDAARDGNVVNRVIRKYGSYNELLVEAQFHARREANIGARTADKARFHGDAARVPNRSYVSEPAHVAYYYDYPSNSSNHQRLRTMWYPGDDGQHKKGRWLTLQYGSSRAQAWGQIAGVDENSTDFFTLGDIVRPVAYEYWSVANVYQTSLINRYFPAPPVGVGLPLIAATSNVTLRALTHLSYPNGKPFVSLDKLNRKQSLQWRKRWAVELSVRQFSFAWEELLADHRHHYDLNDNLLARKDALTNAGHDDRLIYDRLDRLTQHQRGTLHNDRVVSSNLQQQWQHDQSGNWRNFIRSDSATVLAQTREHSRTNHIRDLDGGWVTPVHDRVGNMTRMPRPQQPTQAQDCRYDAWNRLTQVTARNAYRLEFEYDGLGRRIVKRTAPMSGGAGREVRHYYYDQAGQVITEMIDQGSKRVLDREYVWDVNRPGRLVCRIRHHVPGQFGSERLYALHDVQGNVTALVDTWGDVQERFLYDPQGNVSFLNPNFTQKPSQQSSFDWQHLYGNMQRDDFSGLSIAGSNFYHPALGRMLPSGSISVLPESMLNATAADFPFGSWRAAGGMEPFMRWASDQAPWIKIGVGGVAMAGAVVATGAVAAHGNPYALVMGAGAIAGGVQGGIEASLSGGDFSDVMLTAGLGAAFGAAVPWGAFGALAGSAGSSFTAWAAGGNPEQIATAFQWGGLVGGIGGNFTGAARTAVKFGARRALQHGLVQVGPDLLGGGAGAIIGYRIDGTSTGALHGATLGMMAGGISGGLARGLPSVRRGLEAGTNDPRNMGHPRLWAYSDKQFSGDVLSGFAGGRPFVSSVAPTGWENSLRPHHMVQRFFRLGRIRRRPFAREITGAELSNFSPVPLRTPTNILWKRWAGQYAARVPGDMEFGTGIMRAPTPNQLVHFYGNKYAEWAMLLVGVPAITAGVVVLDDWTDHAISEFLTGGR